MKFLRRHPYLITLALLLVVFPVPVFAVGEDLAYGLVVGVFGLFVRLAAMILNFGVNEFVIGFGDVYAKTGVGYAVDTTWIIIRDFVNMAFIFGFVYIGFKMILSSNDSNTRRWLVNLLLAALLVNFSLFVTKVTIDFSNQLASQIVVGGLQSEGGGVNPDTNRYEVDLGQSFLDRMGITSVFKTSGTLQPGQDWGYIFGTAILFMVTAFVFAAGGILLIIRFAILNLFLVLSPLMFLSWILPPLKETMNRYWGMFLGRVFFAPIYFLFIYFSLQIITGLQTATSASNGTNNNLANPSWAGTFQAAGTGASDIQHSTLGTLPFFVLICIFMIASLVIAQKMGADGGMKAVGLGKSLANKARRATGSATIGLAGVAGQQTVGRGARALSNTQGFQNWAANSRVGRAALGATRGVADSSFDARRVGGVGKALGIGEGKKGGFSSRVTEREKKDEEFMKSLNDADMTNPENIRKAEERAKAIEAEGEQAKASAEDAAAGHEEDKEKTSEKLAGEIDDLEKSIDRFTRGIASGTQNGTLTPQEIEKLNKKKEADKIRLQQKQKLQATAKVKEDTQKEIEDLRSQERDQSLTSVERANIRDQRQQAEKEIEEIDKGLQAESNKLKAEIKKAEKQIDTAGSVATNEVKFANKIAFMETAKRRASGTFNAKEQASLKNLQKKFGVTPAEMAEKAASSAAEKALAKQLAELQKNAGEAPKKAEGGEDVAH